MLFRSYSGTDLSIVRATKSIQATDYDIYIDTESIKELGGTWIFSRIELANAEEAGLLLEGSYTSEDESYTIYLYQVR